MKYSEKSFHSSMSVELVGHYHGDSYGGGGVNWAAIGWDGLRIGDVKHGRPAPFRIDRNGTPIGWAPGSSIRLKNARIIVIGMIVAVVR
jgi:hypothetical protein